MKKIIFILVILVAINAASALSCGDTITESIVLTEDLTCSGNGIIIDADNVVIDGNGHTLRGDDTGMGISVMENRNLEIKNLTLKDFEFGIGFIDEIENSLIHDNKVISNDAGILISVFGYNNKVYGNEFRENGRGLTFTAFSEGNKAYNNKFIYNSDTGIRLLQSSYNLFYGNQFIGNHMQIDDLSYGNKYDDGIAGNYWDDFRENRGYPRKYIVNEYSSDNYPFWFQVKCGDLNADNVLNILDVAILTNYVFRNSDPPVPIWAADINDDDVFNIFDVSKLIDHVFRGAKEPNCKANN